MSDFNDAASNFGWARQEKDAKQEKDFIYVAIIDVLRGLEDIRISLGEISEALKNK